MKFFAVTYQCPGRFECSDCQGEEVHNLGFHTTLESAQKYVEECIKDESYYNVRENWTILEYESCDSCGVFTCHGCKHNPKAGYVYEVK